MPARSTNCCADVRPDEIYNLGAQSHVRVSFDVPEYTGEVDALGAVRILEGIRETELNTKFYQASSSELYGKVVETPQKETTPFYPRSPYACAKVYAFYITVKLPRELRSLRLQRHPLQSRIAPPRGDLRHPQDHPRRGADQARACRTASISATSTPSATGALPATTWRPCG